MKPVIAVIFDFDDTLAPDSTSCFLEWRGINPKAFWKSVDPLLEDGWDPVPAYLYRMIEESNRRPAGPITRNSFRDYARRISFFPGVPGVFSLVRKHVASVNPEAAVEFYLVSSGVGETLRAMRIARHFKEIWACDFHYGSGGRIACPRNVVSFTDKTRYLFQVAKGIVGPEYRGRPFAVNRKVAPENLRVPFSNMVYVGDGYTDIPCFSLVKKSGGTAIGVYDRERRDKWGRAWRYAEEGRVSNLVPADYRNSSALVGSLLMATESIAGRIKLSGKTYQG